MDPSARRSCRARANQECGKCRPSGQLRYVEANGVTTIYGNTDGDATPEFQIDLTGTLTLHSWDFIR